MSQTSARLEGSTPALDQAEREWWRQFAEVEERFCWAQTPEVQDVLRGDYLRRIARVARHRRRVIEFGCGAGWLCLQLARAGCANVAGLDWSASQLDRARRNATAAGYGDRIRFYQSDVELDSQAGSFDLVVMHGFLHHLSRGEIGASLESAHRLLAEAGRLIAVEPVLYPGDATNPAALALIHRQQWLAGLQSRGQRFRWRRYSDAERQARAQIERRGTGAPPFGPSPKELPFAPDELPTLMQPLFEVELRSRCLGMSHLVAQEYLLLRLSHPLLARVAQVPILRWARHVDRKLLALNPPPAGTWLFEMFEARRCPRSRAA